MFELILQSFSIPDMNLGSFGHPRLSAKHCKQDLVCTHCCKCGLQHQKECHIRTMQQNQTIQNLRDEILNVKKSRQALMEQKMRVQKRFESCGNVENLKEKLKLEQEQILKQKYLVEEALWKEKVASLKRQLQLMKKAEEERDQYQRLNLKLEFENESLSRQLKQANQQESKYLEMVDSLHQDNKLLSENIRILDRHLEDKERVCSDLQLALEQAQSHCEDDKGRLAELEQEKARVEVDLCRREAQIEAYKQMARSQQMDVHKLEAQAAELSAIVTKLDLQVADNRLRSTALTSQLYAAQDFVALQSYKLQKLQSTLACTPGL